MRQLKVKSGDRISFLYNKPRTGPIKRIGKVNYIKRSGVSGEGLIIFNLFDETVRDYRSFHFREMHDIKKIAMDTATSV